MEFGDRIKEARKRKGLTQKKLADMIGAKHNSISNWENNQNKPDPDTIELICGALDVNPTWLLRGDSEENVIAYEKRYEELRLLDAYKKLNASGREKAFERVQELTYIPMYCNNEELNIAAHAKEGATEEDVQSDIDMITGKDF